MYCGACRGYPLYLDSYAHGYIPNKQSMVAIFSNAHMLSKPGSNFHLQIGVNSTTTTTLLDIYIQVILRMATIWHKTLYCKASSHVTIPLFVSSMQSCCVPGHHVVVTMVIMSSDIGYSSKESSTISSHKLPSPST